MATRPAVAEYLLFYQASRRYCCPQLLLSLDSLAGLPVKRRSRTRYFSLREQSPPSGKPMVMPGGFYVPVDEEERRRGVAASPLCDAIGLSQSALGE